MRFTSIQCKCDFIKNNAVLEIDSFFEWIVNILKNDNVLISKKALNDSFMVSLLFIVDNFRCEKLDFYFDRSLFKIFDFEHNFLIFFENPKPVNNDQLVKFTCNMDSKFEYISDYMLRLYHDFCDNSDITIGDDFILQAYELLEFCDIFRDKIIDSLSKIEFKRTLANRIATYSSVSLCHSFGLVLFSFFAGLVPTAVTGAVSSAAIYPLIHRSYIKYSRNYVTKKFDSLVSLLKRKYFIMSYNEGESLLHVESNPVLKLEHKEKGL